MSAEARRLADCNARLSQSASCALAPTQNMRQFDTPRLACPLLLSIMATFIWLTLGLAYALSVRNLARMSRSPDPWAPSDAPAAARIELAGAAPDRWHGAMPMAQNRS
jgi:hypothetical protein